MTIKLSGTRANAEPLLPAYQQTIWGGEIAICPFCTAELYGRKTCQKCGQRIDWRQNERR